MFDSSGNLIFLQISIQIELFFAIEQVKLLKMIAHKLIYFLYINLFVSKNKFYDIVIGNNKFYNSILFKITMGTKIFADTNKYK